jgi:serine/threonine-protein kinase RsbT
VTVEVVSDGRRRGVRAVFSDDGPGIADLERALRGGFSTARSLGYGLSGTRRLVDEFALESAPGTGTRVTVLKWARFR